VFAGRRANSLISPAEVDLDTLFGKQPPMHPRYDQASKLTGEVIAAAIEVHRAMGPGLIESIYEWCLIKELGLRGFQVTSQNLITIDYKGFQREEPLRYDVLVEECLLLEVKAVESVHPLHKAKVISYLKLMDVPLGLVINFHVEKLTDGISRMLLPGAGMKTGSET
jgi:GxxExxY protein